MKRQIKINTYEKPESLAEDLSSKIKEAIEEQLNNYKKVNLLLPGGSTPKETLSSLSRENIDWSRVNVFTCDEKCLNANDSGRYDNILRSVFFNDETKKTAFYPMLNDDGCFDSSRHLHEKYLNEINKWPNITFIGVGADGHIAAIFEGATEYKEMMNSKENKLYSVKSSNLEEDRVSVSFNRILNSSSIFLILSGQEKLTVLKDAVTFEGKETVLSSLIENYWPVVNAYWSKK